MIACALAGSRSASLATERSTRTLPEGSAKTPTTPSSSISPAVMQGVVSGLVSPSPVSSSPSATEGLCREPVGLFDPLDTESRTTRSLSCRSNDSDRDTEPDGTESPAPPPSPEPASPGAASPEKTVPSTPSDQDQGPAVPAKVVIGSIRIETVEIFDPSIPDENRRAYRLVNHLHIKTREQTVHNQLLFAVGEPLVESRLEDTERNLRALPFIQEASISVENVENGQAAILVRTQDNWTTRLGARFGSAGGKSTGGISLSELNFLGMGKRIELDYRNTLDRTSRELTYQDPNLLGSRYRVKLTHQESSDGQGDDGSFQLPWYSLETPLAWGIDGTRNSNRFSLYQAGDVLAKFDHDARDAEGWIGLASHYRRTSVERWTFGFQYDENKYTPTEDLPKNFPDEKIPDSDTSSGPFFEYSRIRRAFIKVRYFERFSRWEDYNLGGNLTLHFQLSRIGLGATRNEFIYGLTYSRGATMSPVSYLLGNASIKGRTGDRDSGTGHVDLTHYYTAWPRQTFVFKISGDRIVNQSSTNLLLLGGETGLRGYKVRRFDGPNRFLVNLEDRVHFEREYFKLLRLGLAFFLDVGNAWGGERSEEQRVCDFDPMTGKKSCEQRIVNVDNNFGNLKADVGFAILGDVVRASAAGFVRLNIAYPVNGRKYDQGSILISFGRSGGF